MEVSNSPVLITPSRNSINNHNNRKKQFRRPLSNGIEKNEAILVTDGTSQSARRFRNDLGALQRRTRLDEKAVPMATAVIVKPEVPRIALMEVHEEDEEDDGCTVGQMEGSADLPSLTDRLSRGAFYEVNLLPKRSNISFLTMLFDMTLK